jgi:hypothetical protein
MLTLCLASTVEKSIITSLHQVQQNDLLNGRHQQCWQSYEGGLAHAAVVGLPTCRSPAQTRKQQPAAQNSQQHMHTSVVLAPRLQHVWLLTACQQAVTVNS